jgi:cytochrome c peroxidase
MAKKFFILLAVCYSNVCLSELSILETIGKNIFFDTTLSNPVGQSCASCHDPKLGFANNAVVTSGANPELFGNRNTPSIAYSSFSPSFKYDVVEGNIVPVGGQFLDGRENTLEDQVLGPFLNPLEMGNKSKVELVEKIKNSTNWQSLITHFKLFEASEAEILSSVSKAIAAYETSSELVKFTSKYDYWLQGKANLNSLEILGFVTFERIDKGNCAACHTLKKSSAEDKPLLTDFTYDNIGVPINPNNPYYQMKKIYNPQGQNYIDYGLGKSTRIKDANYLGMFKVPTLRNVELTAPYMHNGVFNSLKQVVEFYNSRDQESKWGKPEVPFNVNELELGDLNLTELEIDGLVAFMLTLTDGYQMK